MSNNDQERSQLKQPLDTIRDGNLKASIWRNEGDKGPYFATTFTRTYKDKDGNLRDTNRFIDSDQLKIAELARKSYERTTELRREEFKERRTEQNRARGRDQTR